MFQDSTGVPLELPRRFYGAGRVLHIALLVQTTLQKKILSTVKYHFFFPATSVTCTKDSSRGQTATAVRSRPLTRDGATAVEVIS